MPVDPALLWSMPLLATAAAAAANDDDNDNRGIEIKTFPVMDATYTARETQRQILHDNNKVK